MVRSKGLVEHARPATRLLVSIVEFARCRDCWMRDMLFVLTGTSDNSAKIRQSLGARSGCRANRWSHDVPLAVRWVYRRRQGRTRCSYGKSRAAAVWVAGGVVRRGGTHSVGGSECIRRRCC